MPGNRYDDPAALTADDLKDLTDLEPLGDLGDLKDLDLDLDLEEIRRQAETDARHAKREKVHFFIIVGLTVPSKDDDSSAFKTVLREAKA